MTSDAAAVLRDGLALDDADRATVASELLASLGGPGGMYSAEAAQEWAREIERRIESVARGETDGIDLATLRAQIAAEFTSR